jgi:hypothetical protein
MGRSFTAMALAKRISSFGGLLRCELSFLCRESRAELESVGELVEEGNPFKAYLATYLATGSTPITMRRREVRTREVLDGTENSISVKG